ncbi:MAG: AraC family transcriptional regulator [Treponema sp.]|nr:AraC family transcriptional regulator [Treponema sp.]
MLRIVEADASLSPEIETLVVPRITYAGYRECTPDWILPRQLLSSEIWDLTYVIAGNALYMINGIKYTVSGGDLLCMPAGSMRSGATYSDNPMRCFSINFELKNLHGGHGSLPFPTVSHIGYKKHIERAFRELVFTWRDKQHGYLIKSAGLFLLLISEFAEQCAAIGGGGGYGGDYRIKKTLDYIEIHYAEKLTVRDMSDMAGLNSAYFGELFKQETGCTVNRYVTRLRIRKAEQMLRSGEYQVKDAAKQCGYPDIHHFYKHFKMIVGFPPSQSIPKHAD